MGHEHGSKEKMIVFAVLELLSLTGLLLWFLDYTTYAAYMLWAGVALLLVVAARETLEERRPSIELLMMIVGLVLAYHDIVFEGLIIYALYGIAEVLEVLVERLAVRRLDSLQKLIPRRVTVVDGSNLRTISLDELKTGMVVLVRRGEVVPADGVLLDDGTFDRSLVTGESEPVRLRKGSFIESGSVNLGDPVKVKIMKDPSESTLQVLVNRAIHLLEEKGHIQRLIDRLAPYMIIGVLGTFVPLYLITGPERAVVILLAGCPSAFIITGSAATSFTIASLAKNGIVARGGRALENASRIHAVILDKTGTITIGRLRPVAVKGISSVDGEAMGLIAAVASASLHPLSRAIASAWRPQGSLEYVKEYPGQGVEAVVSGHRVALGSRGFIESKLGTSVDGLSCGDAITVYAAIDGSPLAVCIEEEIDDSAIEAVRELKRMGMHVVIASGDRPEKVEAIARKLGIDEYYGGLTPDDKLELVRKVRSKHGPVSMIGDGLNDLEALAASDLGVAVGNIDAVANVADVVLTRGITQAPTVYSTGRGYMRSLKLGFLSAASVKAAVIVLGMMELMPLWMVALLGDDGSTILGVVTSIGLLLKERI
ncbi:MAG: cadmium-translocating P-type ATPase [Desulfurococcales archaeon]|nr:cadmium-translocating P-type ATPase [Desulfurococcales archaeon]